MKKRLLLLFLILIIIIWQTISTYEETVKSKKEGEQRAISIAKKEAMLTSIDQVSTYYGASVYQVVIGSNKEEENLIVWVPEKEGDLIIKGEKDGITKDKVIEQLINERNPEKILSTTLGIDEQSTPIWEITYIDNQNRYTFYYVFFETGLFKERYSFQR